jgi:hypothetical protein
MVHNLVLGIGPVNALMSEYPNVDFHSIESWSFAGERLMNIRRLICDLGMIPLLNLSSCSTHLLEGRYPSLFTLKY